MDDGARIDGLIRRRGRNGVADESVNAAQVVSYPMSNLVKDTIQSTHSFDDLNIEDWSLDVENLVFEGGGNKGIAYIGALMVSRTFFNRTLTFNSSQNCSALSQIWLGTVQLAHHNSPATHHNSPATHHNSPATHHNSPATHHNSPATHHNSTAAHHNSTAAHHNSPATIFYRGILMRPFPTLSNSI